MTRFIVSGTKRNRNDKRTGLRAFRRMTWLADGKTHAVAIALTMASAGWNVTRIAECETEGRFDNRR